MKRIAVFVDAGYFWVQVGSLINGSYTSRSQVTLNYPDLHANMLAEIGAQLPDGDLLRIYWYDGPGLSGKTAEHHAIDQLDDFKLRLGTRNGVGQQKGVDGLIIADLISLTQQKAITHALLVSGDSDITPGVIAAQSMGLRVHLLSLGAAAATSPFLAAEVDLKRSWGLSEVQKFASSLGLAAAPTSSTSTSATPTPLSASVASASPSPSMSVIAQTAISQIKAGANASIFATLQPGVHTLPREVDGELLSIGRNQLQRVLREDEKKDLRTAFRKLI